MARRAEGRFFLATGWARERKAGPGRRAPGAALATADLAAARQPAFGNRAGVGRPAWCPGGRFPSATGGAGRRTEVPVRAPISTVARSKRNLLAFRVPSPSATGRMGQAAEGPRGSARPVGGAEGRPRARGPVELDATDPPTRVTSLSGRPSGCRPPSVRVAPFRPRARVGPSTGRRTSRTAPVCRPRSRAERPKAGAVDPRSRVRRRERRTGGADDRDSRVDGRIVRQSRVRFAESDRSPAGSGLLPGARAGCAAAGTRCRWGARAVRAGRSWSGLERRAGLVGVRSRLGTVRGRRRGSGPAFGQRTRPFSL